jgi:hypothetical protein
MTFYNIIFGILLLGATQAMFAHIAEWNFGGLLEASTLAVLIFCDVVFTAHVIEQVKVNYTVNMKLLDLLNFLLLSAATLAAKPHAPNMLDINAVRLLGDHRERVFWALLLTYIIAVKFWEFGKELTKNKWYIVLIIAIVAMCVVVWISRWDWLTAVMRLVTFGAALVYLLFGMKRLLDAISNNHPSTVPSPNHCD